MRKLLIIIGLLAAGGLGFVAYLLEVAKEMAPPPTDVEVEVDVTLPR